MRITFYLIFSTIILLCFLSCSKGYPVQAPEFGKVTFKNFTAGKIVITEGASNLLTEEKVDLVSGKHRFRFYDKEVLLSDTSLNVEAFKFRTFFMFRPAESFAFKVFDTKLNGFEDEVSPPNGFLKISLANFSTSLPDKVNIYLTTTTYKAPLMQPIQIGEFLNVSSSFSGFKQVVLGMDNLLHPVKDFTLIIKDTANQQVLETRTFSLPLKPALFELEGNVFLLYADDHKGVPILMSK
jgi:hypothetical protein